MMMIAQRATAFGEITNVRVQDGPQASQREPPT
jgi:hypothetical protein